VLGIFFFLVAQKLGRALHFALAPIFTRSKSEKCFKPAESPTATLATQASEALKISNGVF